MSLKDTVRNFVVPGINLSLQEVWDALYDCMKEPRVQRKIVLVIVSIALLLDNMLYMVIVPIIPDYLRKIGSWTTHKEGGHMVRINESHFISNATGNYSIVSPFKSKLINQVTVYEGEDTAIGVLFASKALIQLMINPISGTVIDRIGYDIPMTFGLVIMFFSTAIFACGRSYGVLFFARSLQGVGSAFADTSGLAMIADTYTEESERTKALGIALAFISFGCLVAPPFGGTLYQLAGKEVPFLILAFVSLFDALMLRLVMRPIKDQQKEQGHTHVAGTPIYKLFMDPYILCCAGALMMSNVSLAFLEPTISLWMMDNMHVEEWQLGMIWLPAFFPHVAGVVLTVKLSRKYPNYQWLMAACGLALEGVSCFFLPFAKNYWVVMMPICTICFGIALIDTALLPTLGYLVDTRYVSVYGSIYAIADISYSFAYAFGPMIAGSVVTSIGFVALNIGIALSNLLYCPILYSLRHVYDYKPFEDESQEKLKMGDPPTGEFQTFTMQEGQQVPGNVKNHLECAKISKGGQQENYGTYEAMEMQVTDYNNQGANGHVAGDNRTVNQRHVDNNPFRQQQQQNIQQGASFHYDQ
ncbi:vesicular acetylcholine transporter-like [Homarus americanus]|uniref:Vesicular acetylcholine transporter-like n=1 Tax=Homarus americanus TaxID=6706 RepID=A0A8J5JDW8_HOMAM|nr:vesicular acetylcholine transporter-like [Homarus americanus]XP_042206730.1 vesicular acetylcholine transporter-like [Homarus americanus]XP_042206731.1 vesicular acetylcholine transporter-like [Homarus americanus]XP_042206732.1 vesicular acetylcholine transporter-like [Homarus americanus]KAG7154886.1 Vesicular acetylcholine transporter-like [Homarus americanus]